VEPASVDEAGSTQTERSQSARAKRQWAAAEARRDELLALWRAGHDVKAIAERLGLRRKTVSAVIAACAKAADKDARRRGQLARRPEPQSIPEADLLAGVRWAAERAGGCPTQKHYAVIARAEGLASVVTVANHFGSWNGAVEAAGLIPPNPHSRTYQRRWPEQSCIEAMGALVAELGELPSTTRYARLAKERGGLPCLGTLRNRLGRWEQIAERLREQQREGTPHTNEAGCGRA
jgi:hypothetical protein